MNLDLCRSKNPDESGQLTQPVWFEDEIYPFYPRKWVNCPYFRMRGFVIDHYLYYKQLQIITFYLHFIVGILIFD